MKTIQELRTALNYDFDVYLFGDKVTPVHQDDNKARFLTSGTYQRLVKRLCAEAGRRDVDSGKTFITPMKYHIECRVNRFGLPELFFAQAIYKD